MNDSLFTRKWLLMALLIFLTPGKAHQLSTAFLNINDHESGQLQTHLHLPVSDLAKVIPFDQNHDNQVTWGEIKGQTQSIRHWIDQNLQLTSSEKACDRMAGTSLQLDKRLGTIYLVIAHQLECQGKPLTQVVYTGFSGLIDAHKLIVNDHRPSAEQTGIIDHNNPAFTYPNSPTESAWSMFTSFTYQGVVHILIGFDHVVFLLCLLLSVFLHHATPGPNRLKNQIKTTLIGISLFTIAHSITLLLVAMQWLIVSFSWVEWLIAITIVFTAINNVFPMTRRVYSLILMFGLIHGMGFANVLIELGVPENRQVLSVLAFNLGVELGQLLLVALAFPILYGIQQKTNFSKPLFQSLSLVAALLAIYWAFIRF